MNNMEPEKEYIHDARHEACNPKFCPFARPVKFVEPEKKDVWEEFDKEFDEKIKYVNYCLSEGDEMLDVDDIKSFIKTHFIPRAEVVERVHKWADALDKAELSRAKDDLLDLLTQE